VPDWLTFLIVGALVVMAASWIRRVRGGAGVPDRAGGRPNPNGVMIAKETSPCSWCVKS
jgi:hypothetical protein